MRFCSYAESEDPDQMSRSAASDLGMHCLSMFLLRGTRRIHYGF